MRILLIEDNPQNRYLLTYLLERQGYEVLQAETGEAGLEAALRHRPDLVLLDVQLPGMSGHEVARRMKSAEATRKIPLMAVTSYAMKGDRETILAAGFDHYVEKPIDPDRFLEAVRTFLSGAKR
ncbi:MAG: response regulator [Deltaproteobacteria bacterium]